MSTNAGDTSTRLRAGKASNSSLTDSTYRVIVIELDDLHPRNESLLPNVLTAVTTSTPQERFERLLQGRRTPAWAKGHVRALRTDLSIRKTYPTLARAKKSEGRLIERLLRQGFVVNNLAPQRRVYVIELDHSHLKNPGKGFVYVGETSKTPEERFRQHMTGARSTKGHSLSSRWVSRFGVRLRPDLAPPEFFLTVEESENAEARCRLQLEQAGYIVKGAHTAGQLEH